MRRLTKRFFLMMVVALVSLAGALLSYQYNLRELIVVSLAVGIWFIILILEETVVEQSCTDTVE